MSTFNELIDFTRSTTGTYLDSVVYGDELVTNGKFATDSDWIKDSGWTISNGQAQCDGTDGAQFRTIDSPLTDGKTYYISYEITAYTSGDIRVLGQGFYGISGNSVSTVTGIFVATKPYVRFYSSAFNGSIDNVSVKEVIGGQVSGTPLLRTAAINEPRLEYDASGNPLGLLIEEARTNLVTQSEDLTTWSKASGGAVVANQTIAPDGTQTADEIVGVVYKAPSIGSDTRSFSVYLKANAGTTAQVRIDVPASNRITVDLTDGSVIYSTGSSLDSYGVKDVGNGWYLCHIVVTGSINNYVIVGELNDASHTVYAWGAQVETGAFPTSYIPTSGSTVTRAADIASLPVERFAYNQSKGSIVVAANRFSNAATFPSVFQIDDSTDGNRHTVEIRNTAGTVFGSTVFSSSTQAGLGSAAVGDSLAKLGYAYKSNDFSFSNNGSAALTDSSGTVPTVSSALIGSRRTSGISQYLNGHIKQIQYYPKRLSNTELQLLTQPSASPTMNLTFDGQATSTLVEGLHD